jgi:hypothetical protein
MKLELGGKLALVVKSQLLKYKSSTEETAAVIDLMVLKL